MYKNMFNFIDLIKRVKKVQRFSINFRGNKFYLKCFKEIFCVIIKMVKMTKN